MPIIPDKELDLTKENDLFNTRVYVDTLQQIVKRAEPDESYTIGLFGGWGSGKSSIVRTLKNQLDQEENIATILYDAWKYSKDAFRRSFLLEVKEQLHLAPESSFNEFYFDKIEDIDHKLTIRKIPLLFTAPIIVIGLFLVIFSLCAAATTIQQIIGVFSGVGITLFTILLQFLLQNLFVTYKIAQIKQKMFSPEQFQGVFNEAIQSVLFPKKGPLYWFKENLGRNHKIDKVIIIIDNIDRCHKGLATELLLTVKNFLEVPNCIFVIPIDDEAIKSHLEYANLEGEEFLRKFFNMTIRIKKYSTRDLYEFTRSLIKKYKLQFSDNVASIVSQEFSRSPRRIIQFLNNLSVELTVAKHQEKAGVVTEGSITTNTDFLAKILLIREEWPNLYEQINSAPDLLYQLSNYIKEGKFEAKQRENEETLYTISDLNLYLTQQQYRFLYRTKPITTVNIDPFLRLQDFDKDIPDVLFDHINNGDWLGLKDYLTENSIDIQIVFHILREQLDQAITKRGLIETEGFYLLNLFFEIIADEDYEDEFETIYEVFEPFTTDSRIRSIIPNFSPQNLLKYSVKLSQEGKDYLRDHIAQVLNQLGSSVADIRGLVKEYIKSYITSSDALTKIKPAFSELITADLTTLEDEDYEELLKQSGVASSLIKPDIVNNNIEGIENKYEDKETIRRVKILNFLNAIGVVTGKQKCKYLQKIHPFANNNNWEQSHFWLVAMTNFVEEAESLGETGLWPTLENRHNYFFQQFYAGGNRGQTETQCVMALISLLKEYYVASGAVDAPANKFILTYFNRNESREVYLHANTLLQEIMDFFKVYDWPFADSVIARFDSIADFNDKKEIAWTLLKMLKQTKHNKEGWKGLNQEQVNAIIDKFLSILFSGNDENSKEAENWFTAILKMRSIKPILGEKIGSLTDITQLKQALTLVDKFQDEQLTLRVVDTILNSDLTYAGLVGNVQKITQIADSSLYIRKSLLKLLGQIKIGQLDTYKDVVQASVEYQGIFDDNDLEIVIDNLARLLSQDFQHAIFACSELLKLKSIPSSKKVSLKHLIKFVNIPDDENSKKNGVILKNLQKKIG